MTRSNLLCKFSESYSPVSSHDFNVTLKSYHNINSMELHIHNNYRSPLAC